MQLIEALQELHNGGSPMSANIARKLVTVFREKENSEFREALSKRETEILQLLSKVYCIKKLLTNFLFRCTVRQHIHKIYEKLHVQNPRKLSTRPLGKIKTWNGPLSYRLIIDPL
jgi:DNA-binding NarL/FixJ family response regulator